MRTVVLVIMAVLLLACAACVGIGYFKVVPLFRDLIEEGGEAVSASMAATLRRSVIAAIDADDVAAGTIVLREVDLRVSDSVAVETGEAGFETGTNGTRVYGLAIAVDEDAVSLLIGDEVIYSGVPEVVDGDVVLTGVEGSGSAFDWFISKELFVDAFETGLNDALAMRDAEPVAVDLRDGALVLTVAGAASTASPVSDPRPRAA